MPNIICKDCNKSFNVSYYRLKRGSKEIFCSRNCMKSYTKKINSKELTQDDLHSMFSYNSENGKLVRKYNRRGNHIGESGYVDDSGYLHIRVNDKPYLAHRLVWLFHNGKWPKNYLDHINGIPGDDRIENLREATQRQNTFNKKMCKNNTTGFKGVSRRRGKFRATIRIDYKHCHLGDFLTPEAAHAAYVEAAKKHFGEFARAS